MVLFMHAPGSADEEADAAESVPDLTPPALAGWVTIPPLRRYQDLAVPVGIFALQPLIP